MSEYTDFNSFVNSWWPFAITCFFSIIAGIRMYIGGAEYHGNGRLDGKTVLITGGSGGLGLCTAKELAKRGAKIILTCRHEDKGVKAKLQILKESPNSKIDLRILDVSILDNIKKFCENLRKDYDVLDILINNAGIIFHPFHKTADGNEMTMATNYFGPFALTHYLLPLLKKSENGRVINITALAHFAGKIDLEDLNLFKNFQMREAYAQSKLALVVFTKQMAALYKKTKITFNCVNPGLVRGTDHLKRSFLKSSWAIKFMVWPWMWLFLKTPKQGVQTILYAAIEPSLNNVSGCYFSDCGIQPSADLAHDHILADCLYKKSCEICEIDSDAILRLIAPETTETEFIEQL